MRYSRPMCYTVADSVCQSNPCNAIGGKCMVTDDATTNNSPMFYCECNAGYVGYLCEGEYNLLFDLITELMCPVCRGVLVNTNTYNTYFVERHIQ